MNRKYHVKSYKWKNGKLEVLSDFFHELEEALEHAKHAICDVVKIFDHHGKIVHHHDKHHHHHHHPYC